MRTLAIAPIRAYQRFVSPPIPRRCKYHPTCSAYALEALERGEITAGHARALLMLEPEDRLWGLKEILEKGLSVRQAEALRERLAMAPKRSAEPSPLSLELSRHLGLPVRVVGGKKGKVVIQYRSLEELEALLRRLGYQA